MGNICSRLKWVINYYFDISIVTLRRVSGTCHAKRKGRAFVRQKAFDGRFTDPLYIRTCNMDDIGKYGYRGMFYLEIRPKQFCEHPLLVVFIIFFCFVRRPYYL